LEAKIQDGKLTVLGQRCPKGSDYARSELLDPRRTLTSTVRTSFRDRPRLPVRTSGDIPLSQIFAAMAAINGVVVAERLRAGDMVLERLPGCDAALIATDDLAEGGLSHGTNPGH
jgi:CxxC motif-containing protein